MMWGREGLDGRPRPGPCADMEGERDHTPSTGRPSRPSLPLLTSLAPTGRAFPPQGRGSDYVCRQPIHSRKGLSMRLALFPCVERDPALLSGRLKRRYAMGLVLLCVLICCERAFGLPRLHAQGTAFDHTAPALDETCNQAYYSPDGNPFQLCPGPYPGGGNCVWWAWEQWHLLGYDLPLNWGNAAEWGVDAERTGLPLGTTPQVGAIAVFPVADGVWAFGPAGHVAFVTWVSADGGTFNVTYQNYGDSTPMFLGKGYPVAVINAPRYQQGELRFIYFPRPIDPTRFARLPGIDGQGLAEVTQANLAHTHGSATTLTPSQPTLGLPQRSAEQEYPADL